LALHQNYYAFLLLPLGIGIYLLIKFISDSSASNKNLIMNISENWDDKAPISLNEFRDKLALFEEVNNNRFIIKETALNFKDIVEFEKGSVDKEFKVIEKNYLMSLLYFYGLGYVYGDMVYLGNRNQRNGFAGRVAYDLSIRYGTFNLDKKESADSFIRRNNIVFLEGLSLNKLVGNFSLFLTTSQKKKLEIIKLIPSKNNAVLMLKLSNHLIRVICC
jgi:hypothetical protein